MTTEIISLYDLIDLSDEADAIIMNGTETSYNEFRLTIGDDPSTTAEITFTDLVLTIHKLNLSTVETSDEPKTEIEVSTGNTDEFSINLDFVKFDDTIWSGDAYYVVTGTTATVVGYLAETMDELPYEDGRKVVIRAIKIGTPEVTDVLFSNRM